MPTTDVSSSQLLDEFRLLADDQGRLYRGEVREIAKTTNEKLDSFASQLREFKEKGSRPPAALGPTEGALIETAGSRFVRSAEFKNWIETPGQRGRAVAGIGAFPLETRATVLNVKPGPTRLAALAPYPQLTPNFVTGLTWRPVSGTDEITFLRETRRPTPGAKTAPPTTLKAEQDLDVVAVTSPILTIACWTSASLQSLSDISQLERFIDQSLIALTLSEIDRQALVGGGGTASPPELAGVVGAATAYEVARNKAGDTVLDTLSHGATQLGEKGAAPNVAVLHPADVERARLVKSSAGEYIIGAPAGTGASATLWSLQVIADPHMSAGSFLIGDSRTCEVLDRQVAMVEVSREHSDYFVKNMAALRCEARVGLGLYVPAAWVTGSFPGPAVLAADAESARQTSSRK